MIKIHPAAERGTTRTSWLKSRHSFSFGHYHNPAKMGFRALRVINDDVVAGGGGFGEHPHRDMEIISYVVEGGLEHRDSLGNGGVIRPGEVQIMSAGTGILHAEFNASKTDPVRFLQIWLPPSQAGLTPRYDQKRFPISDQTGTLHRLVDPDGTDGALTIHQDARIFGGRFHGTEDATYDLDPSRHAWVQVVNGSIMCLDRRLSQGDGAAISELESISFTDGEAAEILLFDLA